jgi:hypothetical protein
MVNYNNSIIYKLCCKDIDVKEIYVGSTTNFTRRRQQHKECCNNNNLLPVYCFIRANGGWENWDMVEIEKYSCNDKRELHTRERYWIESLKSNLNCVIPTRTDKEYTLSHKEEKKKYDSEYYKKNKEKIINYQKKYYKNNPDKKQERNEYLKNYQEKNKEKKNEYLKNYQEKNKEKLLDYRKEYYQKNKEKNKEYYKNNKETILEQRKQYKKKKYYCESCKKELTLCNKSAHEKTFKHLVKSKCLID